MTTTKLLNHRTDRRSLVKGGAAGLAGLALLKATGTLGSTPSAHAYTAGVMPGPLAWVWRFQEDGTPAQVRDVLAAHGVGVLLKVFDGVNWMAKYDKGSPMPMNGPESVRQAADFFESAGVPFHAWCVVNGEDPIREAQMASMTLDAGARTLSFDLELPEGTNYWQAGPAEAAILGAELRRLQPNAYLTVAPDARPWQVEKLPMAEFAAFCNDIAPQTYWRTFDTSANHKLLAKYGFPVGAEGLTPELIVDATYASLRQHGKPVRPVGQGATNADEWYRFANHAYNAYGMANLSTWRVGTTAGDVWHVLGMTDTTKPPPPAPAPAPAVEEVAPAQEPAATSTPATPTPEASKTPVASSTPQSETSSTRSANGDSASGSSTQSVSGANGKTTWRDRLTSAVKSTNVFGGK